LRSTGNAVSESALANMRFALLAVLMLATPVLLFAVGVARNSVFLIDGSGALFGTDTVLLFWLRDRWAIAPDPER
jgi:hypothetical protein